VKKLPIYPIASTCKPQVVKWPNILKNISNKFNTEACKSLSIHKSTCTELDVKASRIPLSQFFVVGYMNPFSHSATIKGISSVKPTAIIFSISSPIVFLPLFFIPTGTITLSIFLLGVLTSDSSTCPNSLDSPSFCSLLYFYVVSLDSLIFTSSNNRRYSMQTEKRRKVAFLNGAKGVFLLE